MADTPAPEYQVLARKYRPASFDDLLGHDAMVRTLRNAFDADRIAHAFILTGVRGVGKTTTARILARALNYETDEVDRPTVDMPVEGKHCRAIAESRHPDVMEMDAASRTGIGDIRELIEGVRYAPTQARNKVYIIDEVHMLSNQAFNGLLKTLEEPPPHVHFVFATTEIRKVPVTVLSRCQRFDLRRFDAEMLADHLQTITGKEGREAEREALLMLARAAEGSVRDALSLLDQALIQHTDGVISAEDVRAMLGLVDRTTTWELLGAAMRGDAPEALSLFRDSYDAGADPAATIRDLLEITHLLTRVKAAGPAAGAHGRAGSADAERAIVVADAHVLPALTRAWTLLMKALDETMTAPDPAAAAEIGLVRIAYAAQLPTPEEAIRALEKRGGPGQPPIGRPSEAPTAQKPSAREAPETRSQLDDLAESPAPATVAKLTPGATPPEPASLQDLAGLSQHHRDAKLSVQIDGHIAAAEFAPGYVKIEAAPTAAPTLQADLTKALAKWTGRAWRVDVSTTDAGKSMRQTRRERVENDPLVKTALETFPGATIGKIRQIKTSTEGDEQ